VRRLYFSFLIVVVVLSSVILKQSGLSNILNKRLKKSKPYAITKQKIIWLKKIILKFFLRKLTSIEQLFIITSATTTTELVKST